MERESRTRMERDCIMTTRQRNTVVAVVAVLVALAMAITPALTPAALAYNADAARPDDSAARFILPDWDIIDDGIAPFGGHLVPRRAMEHPREWTDWVSIGTGLASIGCALSGWCGTGAAVGLGLVSVGTGLYGLCCTPDPPACPDSQWALTQNGVTTCHDY